MLCGTGLMATTFFAPAGLRRASHKRGQLWQPGQRGDGDGPTRYPSAQAAYTVGFTATAAALAGGGIFLSEAAHHTDFSSGDGRPW